MLNNKNNNKLIILVNLIIWILLSWLLIHFLAGFGIFVAAAYPIWWLFFPDQTVCFSCRTKKQGQYCPMCKKEVDHDESVSPKNFISATYSGLIILLITFVSIGLVCGEKILLNNMGFPPAPRSVSFTIPSRGQYKLGEIFPLTIEITDIKTSINAVQADLGFDPTKLEIVDITTDNSFANIFIQKELDNETGYARLTGGLPNPGFYEEKGIFATAYFKAKSPGLATVEFLPSSMVLANDGKGTDVIKEYGQISYLILPERISKEEEEAQKSLITDSSVLGTSSTGVQLTFFEEDNIPDKEITIQLENSKIERKNFLEVLAIFIEQVDTYIIGQWCRLLQ